MPRQYKVEEFSERPPAETIEEILRVLESKDNYMPKVEHNAFYTCYDMLGWIERSLENLK